MELAKFLGHKEKLALSFPDECEMRKYVTEERKRRVWIAYVCYSTGNFNITPDIDVIKRVRQYFDEHGKQTPLEGLSIPEQLGISDFEPWFEKTGVLSLDEKTFSRVLEKIAKFTFVRCGTISPHTSFPIPEIENGKIKFLMAMRLVTINGVIGQNGTSGFLRGTTHNVSSKVWR